MTIDDERKKLIWIKFSDMKIFKQTPNLLSKLKCIITVRTLKIHFLSTCKPIKLPNSYTQILSTLQKKSSIFSRCVSIKSGKIYQETENEYAHFVMEKNKAYSSSLLQFPLQIKNVETFTCQSNVFDKFVKISIDNIDGLSLECDQYSNIVGELCISLPKATDDDIKKTLHHLCMWPPTPKTFTPNFKALWNTLDRECVKRMENWNVSTKLLIADYWFVLRLSRITQYNKELIHTLLKNCQSLSSQQLIQLMFYINLQRQLPYSFLPSLEKKLESIINLVTIEEIGIICIAYFKTESKVSSASLIQSIINKFMQNVDIVNTVTVSAILKFLRKSLNLSLIDSYISTMHKSIPYLKNWDIPTSVHLALLSSECSVYHPLLLKDVAEKLANQIKDARIKDCTKLSQCLVHFNHFEENFYNLVFAETQKSERHKEIDMYPKDLVYLSLYYAYVGHFNYEMLSKIFKKSFFEPCYMKYPDILHAFTEIDYCIEIECHDYSGPKLELAHRKILKNRRGNLPSKSMHQNMQTRLLVNVYDSLVEILGSNHNIHIRHILPHAFAPDIIIRLQTEAESSVQEICDNISSEDVLIPPKDETWASFVVCGLFSFAHRSKQITGVTAMKLRQLHKLGYRVALIPYYDLPQNPAMRKLYINNHLVTLEEKSEKHVC